MSAAEMAAGLHGNSSARIAEPTEFRKKFAESSFDYSTLPTDIGVAAKAAAARIKEHMKGAVTGVGTELLRIKEKLPHGEFGKWLKAEFGLTARSAQNYMCAAELVGKCETVSYLKPKTLYLLAAPSTPEPAKQAVIEQLTAGQAISHAEVKKTIDEAKDRQWQEKRRAEKAALGAAEAAVSPHTREAREESRTRENQEQREYEDRRADDEAVAKEFTDLIVTRLQPSDRTRLKELCLYRHDQCFFQKAMVSALIAEVNRTDCDGGAGQSL